MKKLVICALALGGFAAAAQAADLSVDSLKDPLPDTLTYKGVTLYGTIDVSGFYSSASMPNSGAFYASGQQMWSNKFANRDYFGFGNNSMEQSKIGIKVEEGIGYGFAAIAKIETGFNPLYGELADACGSIVRASGQKPGNMPYNGDGSRCGQAFNGEVYAGVTNSAYGTLTFGRQNSLVLDNVNVYDPQGGSYAFSILGLTGTSFMGATETARWDDSVKYKFVYGPFHAAVAAAAGSQDSSIQDGAVAGDVGFAWKGLSVDATYTKERGAVALSADQTSPISSNGIPATVSNNEIWSVMGKYTFDVPALWGVGGYKDGCGFKDECPTAKFTIYGGYVHIDLSNPDRPEYAYNGNSTLSGYGLSIFQAPKATVRSSEFLSDRILETSFVGGKYEVGAWSFTGAYYHIGQNNYQYYKTTDGSLQKCSGNNLAGNKQNAGCTGTYDVGSFVIDYTFNKHFDVYAGVTASDIEGGLANGYIKNDSISGTVGARLKF